MHVLEICGSPLLEPVVQRVNSYTVHKINPYSVDLQINPYKTYGEDNLICQITLSPFVQLAWKQWLLSVMERSFREDAVEKHRSTTWLTIFSQNLEIQEKMSDEDL